MNSLLDAFVKIFADSKDVSKVLKQTIPKQAEDAGKDASSKFSKAFSSVKGQIVQGIGQGLGIALAQFGGQIAGAIGGFVADSIGAASDLNEELTKSEAIFGDNADAIQEWADDASASFGQSSRAALQAASNFAGLFKSVGVSMGEATEQAQVMTELGSDLASFFNTDVESALQALRSGLSGEAEALKRYNVFLTEARVAEFAFANGIAESGKELTQQQKVMARYGLILQDTADAQGDFAKTADGLANTQRTLTAEMEDLAAELGQELLPYALDFARWMRDEGIPLLRSLIQFIFDASEGVDALAFAFGFLTGSPTARLQATIAVMDEMGISTAELRRQAKAAGLDIETFSHTVHREMPKAEQDVRGFGRSVKDIEDQVARSSFGITQDVEDIGDQARDTAAAWRRAAETMITWSQNLADEAETTRTEVTNAVLSLIDEAYAPLLLEYEIVAVEAELSAARQERAAEGLTRGEKQELDARIVNLQVTHQKLLAEQAQYGSDAQRAAYLQSVLVSKAMMDGLASEDETRKAKARAAAGVIVTELVKLVGPAGLAGFKTGDAYVDKLIAALIAGQAPLKRTLGAYKTLLQASSPPSDPENPLHEIDKWAERTGDAYVQPLVAAIAGGESDLRRALGTFAGALRPPSYGQMDRRGNWSAQTGRALMGVPSPAPVANRGAFGNRGGVTVNVTGLVRARDPLEIAFQMQRAADTGVLAEEPEYA
jgi:hypothetical protein